MPDGTQQQSSPSTASFFDATLDWDAYRERQAAVIMAAQAIDEHVNRQERLAAIQAAISGGARAEPDQTARNEQIGEVEATTAQITGSIIIDLARLDERVRQLEARQGEIEPLPTTAAGAAAPHQSGRPAEISKARATALPDDIEPLERIIRAPSRFLARYPQDPDLIKPARALKAAAQLKLRGLKPQ